MKFFEFSNNITTVRVSCLISCYGLKKILIKNVSVFETYCFGYAYTLESITLPYTLTTIGSNAFIDCHMLKEIVINAINPPVITSSSFSLNQLTKIYVPDASLNAYKTATNWNIIAGYIYPISSKN
jgi:hypothetical protein